MSEARKTGLDDPLLAALVAKLPAPGNPWPRGQRVNWMRMIAIALNEAYGLEEPIVITDVEPARTPLSRSLRIVSEDADGAAAPVAVARPRYVIDPQGFALCDSKAIDPEDVPAGEVLIDERSAAEQGDLSTVYWKTGGVRKPEAIPNLKLRAA